MAGFLSRLFSRQTENVTPVGAYAARNQLWSLKELPAGEFRNQEYYEDARVVDAYDIVGFIKGEHDTKPSSFFRPTSFQFLDLARSRKAKSFLDIGCGAGFFRYLLDKYYELPLEGYKGVDISTAQIERARKRFPDEFEVADAGDISRDEMNSFDAIHIYSVLNFMRPERQIHLIENLLASTATTLIDFSVTEPRVEYCPDRTFNNLGRKEIDGKKLLSQIGFCLLDDIQDIVARSGKYQIKTEQIEFSVMPVYNNTDYDGPILIDQSELDANKKAAKQEFGVTTRLKAHNCIIWPKHLLLPDIEVPAELQQHI